MKILLTGSYLHNIKGFLLCCLFWVICVDFSHADIKRVDFDESMGISELGRYNLMLQDGVRSERFLNFYRDLYNTNFVSSASSSNSVKIPKIIHEVWVGPKPFPKLYQDYADACKAVNPGWEYKLWTEKDIESVLAIDPKYTDLYNIYRKHKRYPAQKDILAFLILYKYGGVYLDADVKCIQSFETLSYNYDFFSALEPANTWTDIPIMTAAIVGSKKGNQIFIDTLDTAVEKYDRIYKESNAWHKKLGRSIRNISKSNKNDIINIPDSREVLMLSLGDNLVERNDKYNSHSIVFPATYFNPIMPPLKYGTVYGIKNHLLYFLGYYSNKDKTFTEVKPETIAVQDFYD